MRRDEEEEHLVLSLLSKGKMLIKDPNADQQMTKGGGWAELTRTWMKLGLEPE